jgi:hypothetical protein
MLTALKHINGTAAQNILRNTNIPKIKYITLNIAGIKLAIVKYTMPLAIQ